MAAPQAALVGEHFYTDTLRPSSNMHRNDFGNGVLDIVVRCIIRVFTGTTGVYTTPADVANEHRAIHIPRRIKFTLTVNSFGTFVALIPMDSDVAERMAQDSLCPRSYPEFLAFRDDPAGDYPVYSRHESIIISPATPAWPYRVFFHHGLAGKKHMIFTTFRSHHLVHFLDNLLAAGMALVVTHNTYDPPVIQLHPKRAPRA
jgi:hypothetical protein